MNKKPPKLPLRFFRWYCHPDYMEDIEGDILERYEKNEQDKSSNTAKWGLVKDIIRLFRPGITRPFFLSNKLSQASMLFNNLKLGFRNLSKRKEYTFINTIGLAIGIASALLIFLYVQNQFSYDKSFKDSGRIYKMVQEIRGENGTEMYGTVPYSLVNIMIDDYAEVETGTAIAGPYESQLVTVRNAENEDVQFIENSVLLADSNFFKVFNLEMLLGDPSTALSKPHSVVLTERTAKRFFGDIDPVGKFIAPSGKPSLVTGVCENPPSNSHLQFNYIVSSTSVGWLSQEKFNMGSANCYFKLRAGTNPKDLESKLPELVENYTLAEIERSKNISREDYKKAGNGFEYFLKPLTSLHLGDENLGGFKPGGNIVTVNILIVTGVLMLIIACINFMNLSTAKSTERAREVGVRKVMGSLKGELVAQFLTESFIISFVSMAIGVILALVSLPYFNAFTNDHMELPINFSSLSILFIVGMGISIVSGIYPAFILSSFSPLKALKGAIKSSAKGRSVMNGLVLFQFWIAVILIVSTLIIHKQVRHINEKDLGFDKEQVMVIEGIDHLNSDLFLPFMNEIKDFPQVAGSAGSLWVQGFQGLWHDNYRISGSEENLNMNRILIGDQFSEVMNFELKEGALFSEITNDSSNVILNQSAVKALGLTDPIGQKLILRNSENRITEEHIFTVKGVIKDFHYNSLHEEIEPLVIQSNEAYYGRMRYITVKLKGGATPKTIDQIESKWTETLPDRTFSFRFLDDTLDAKYKSEQQTATILTLFSSLTICIACLGLFALSSYTISIRIREIGIRKVLGAKVFNIILLLSKDFIRLSLISFLLASPVAWYIGSSWLDSFAYRIEIDASIFIASALIIVLVVCMTLSLQTLRAARANPVDSLRSE